MAIQNSSVNPFREATGVTLQNGSKMALICTQIGLVSDGALRRRGFTTSFLWRHFLTCGKWMEMFAVTYHHVPCGSLPLTTCLPSDGFR
jgi:hypothetical protein